jgi:hypothetical protein
VSWWPGDGSASDIADNNPGKLVGATFVPGVVDQAFSLPGNAFVEVADSSNLDFGSGDFTVEFWMRTTQVAVGTAKAIVSKFKWVAPESSQMGFEVHLFPVEIGGGIVFVIGDGLTHPHQGTRNPAPSLTDGNWHHVAAVKTATELRLYVDGFTGRTTHGIAGSLSNDVSLQLGRPPAFPISDRDFVGSLDEVSVYNRALTQGEVLDIVAAGAAGRCKPPGQPTDLEVVVSESTLTFNWAYGGGQAPTSHMLTFFQGGGPVANVPTGPGNSAQVTIPPGVFGTFSATVTPYLGAISGPASAPVTFTIVPPLPGRPTDVQASVSGATLTVSWVIGSGAAPTSHVLTFFQGGVPVANVPTGPGNSAQVAIPPGVSGTFNATVTPYLGAISGPASAPVTFTIGPGQPTDVKASVFGATLTVSWVIGSGAAPSSHVLRFYQGSLSVASLETGGAPSVQIPVPGGVSGTFMVTVTAVAGTTPGPPSAPASFTIAECVAPLPVAGLTGAVVAATATVSWNPSPGATSYVVQAGASQGGTELFNDNVGNVTSVSASGLPSGFTAWVRIIAVNACGSSAPRDVFVQ